MFDLGDVMVAFGVACAGVVSTALFNKGDFRYPFMVATYFMQLLYGQSPVQGAQSTIYAATGVVTNVNSLAIQQAHTSCFNANSAMRQLRQAVKGNRPYNTHEATALNRLNIHSAKLDRQTHASSMDTRALTANCAKRPTSALALPASHKCRCS
jgi:hypothetical protein